MRNNNNKYKEMTSMKTGNKGPSEGNPKVVDIASRKLATAAALDSAAFSK